MPQIIRFQSSYQETYPTPVEGESNYRRNLELVTNYAGEEDGVDVDDLVANLILDDGNTYDPGNAVKVAIQDRVVGYLSKSTAKRYRNKLKELNIPYVTGECYASVRGGFIRKDGGQADFGVRLDIDIDTLEILNTPAIPAQTRDIPAAIPVANSMPSKPANQNNYAIPTSDKNKWVAFALCFFLGMMGAHLFYVGRFGRGLLYLFTCGLFGIGWIVDIFVILGGGFKDAGGTPLRK